MKYENKKRVDDICREIDAVNNTIRDIDISNVTFTNCNTYPLLTVTEELNPVLYKLTLQYKVDAINLYKDKLASLHKELNEL